MKKNSPPREGDTLLDEQKRVWIIVKEDLENKKLYGHILDDEKNLKVGQDILNVNMFPQWQEGKLIIHSRREQTVTTQREDDEQRLTLAINLAKGTGYIYTANIFVREQPLYYDESKIWWIWNHNKKIWVQTDETNILNLARTTLQLIGDSTVKKHGFMVEALRQVGRENKPDELEKEWVQYGGTLYNIKTQQTKPSDPSYFSTNTIPWELADHTNTPTIDELFESWVGKKYVTTLYEILAYCTYRSYPIHVIIVCNGSGRNGKSRYYAVMDKLLGQENIATTNLERLADNRFETFTFWELIWEVYYEPSSIISFARIFACREAVRGDYEFCIVVVAEPYFSFWLVWYEVLS